MYYSYYDNHRRQHNNVFKINLIVVIGGKQIKRAFFVWNFREIIFLFALFR
jgi:hypothetical protein